MTNNVKYLYFFDQIIENIKLKIQKELNNEAC